MSETWNKKEREKKKKQNRKEKLERKQERKINHQSGKTLDEMLVYIDENGNFSETPPDPRKKIQINVEDIHVGVPKQKELDPTDLIRKGTISFFNENKGFGFIRDKESGESIFVHIKSLIDPVEENSHVIFEIEFGPKGANAVNVKLDSK
ncbi:MAG: cold shock domain-containing protein [Bacteroidetes bacterium]|nr:cold shock domain-containing protein [Bacteroidota bacterium]